MSLDVKKLTPEEMCQLVGKLIEEIDALRYENVLRGRFKAQLRDPFIRIGSRHKVHPATAWT